MKKLNLGCGDKILDGYVNVDIVESRLGNKADVVCDIRKLTIFEDNSVDEVLSVHVIEHFWRWEVPDILKEWTRVLKSGGRMVIECPNILTACEEILKDPIKGTSNNPKFAHRGMWILYGDPRWQDPLMMHKWGYSPVTLAAVMHDAGLTDFRQEPAQFKFREPRDMRVVGIKP